MACQAPSLASIARVEPLVREDAQATATDVSGAAETVSRQRRRPKQVTVKNKTYQRLDCVGKGGSARVYRVMAENKRMFALKVSLRDIDETGLQGFKGEIELLVRLRNEERVIHLLDCDFDILSDCLNLVMELGEIDLGTILKRRVAVEKPLDFGFVRCHWRRMLEAVFCIHKHGIVHFDLKPANFLLVSGMLKLIDFGIAGAIQENTINIHQENQVGTPNYMAPEALLDCNRINGFPQSEAKLVKVGKPSDVWSLGCILYLIVYGTQPFGHLDGPLRKCLAITNPDHEIGYAADSTHGEHIPETCRETLKACLSWEQDQRPRTEDLMNSSNAFLYPDQFEVTLPSLTALLWETLKGCQDLESPWILP